MTSTSKGKQRERSASISIKSSNHSDTSPNHQYHSHPHPSHPQSQSHPHQYQPTNPIHSSHSNSDFNTFKQPRPMNRVAGRESSTSSSIVGPFHSTPNQIQNHNLNRNIPYGSSSNPYHQHHQQSNPLYRSITPTINPLSNQRQRYPNPPTSISSRSEIDLIGDGPPIGLVRPPPTISSDGGLNNLQSERGIDDDQLGGGEEEEEGDGQPPLIFHCKKCGKVIGDTWSWVTARTDMRIVVLTTVTDVVSPREELLTSKDAGPLTGSPYTVVDCSNCNVTLGKIYRMTPKERDDLRDAYSLNVDALSIYPVGSANQSVGSIPPDTALRLTPGSFPAPTSAASNEAVPNNLNGNGNGNNSGHAPATFHELSQLRMLVMTMGERLVKLEGTTNERLIRLEGLFENLKNGNHHSTSSSSSLSPFENNLISHENKNLNSVQSINTTTSTTSATNPLGSNSHTPTKFNSIGDGNLKMKSKDQDSSSTKIQNGKSSKDQDQDDQVNASTVSTSNLKAKANDTKLNNSETVPPAENKKGLTSTTTQKNRSKTATISTSNSTPLTSNTSSSSNPSSSSNNTRNSKRKKIENDQKETKEKEETDRESKKSRKKSKNSSNQEDDEKTLIEEKNRDDEGSEEDVDVHENENDNEDEDDFDADPSEAFESDLRSPRNSNSKKIGNDIGGGGGGIGKKKSSKLKKR